MGLQKFDDDDQEPVAGAPGQAKKDLVKCSRVSICQSTRFRIFSLRFVTSMLEVKQSVFTIEGHHQGRP